MIQNLPKTRKEALRIGATHYYTGRACKHGHFSLRVSRGNCLACEHSEKKRAHDRAYSKMKLRTDPEYRARAAARKQTPEAKVKRAAYDKKRRLADGYREIERERESKRRKRNPGRSTEDSRRRRADPEYRRKELERFKARFAERYKNDPVFRGSIVACANKRKAAKLQRTPSWANLEAIKAIYQDCPEGHQVDHIIPLQGANVSGLHLAENLRHLPRSENASKGNRWHPQIEVFVNGN